VSISTIIAVHTIRHRLTCETCALLISSTGSDLFESSSSISDEHDGNDTSSPTGGFESVYVHISLFVNGECLGEDPILFTVDANEELRAAVSLYRPGTRVEIHCCPEDMKFMPWLHLPHGTRSLSGKGLPLVKLPYQALSPTSSLD